MSRVYEGPGCFIGETAYHTFDFFFIKMNDIFHVVNRNTQDITSLHDNKTTVIRTIDDMNGTEI